MILKLDSLTKIYKDKVALDGITFSFTPGIYGLLGPNGAGKSTMMNLITDNLNPTKGSVLLDGKTIDEVGSEYRKLLGYMPQQQNIYPELSLSLHVSRIYRDARRLFGRGPMKDYLWFSIFSGKSAEGEIPSFFFGIDPEGYSYGMDYWGNTADVMTRYRRAILANPAPMLDLVRKFSKQDQFQLAGPLYARSKGTVDPLLQSWFDRRYLTLIHERPHDETGFSPALARDMLSGFDTLIPLYRYLLTVVRQAQ